MDAPQLEAGLPTANQEKQILAAAYSSNTPHNELQPQHRRKMRSSRRVVLAILALVLVTLGVASAVPARTWGHGPCDAHDVEGIHVQADGGQEESNSFPCLLNAVSSEALHDVLHRYFPNRFKDGIYESDKNAMEAVHREDASLATSLVKIAKRQGGGNNTTTAAPTTPQPTTRTTVPAPTTPTTTRVEPTPTSQPQTTGPAPTTPSTRQTTPSTSPTKSAAPTTNQATPSTASTSSTSRSRSSRPVTSTFTSTASNGGLVVVTQTSFVDADPGEPTGTHPSGSLQTNAAVSRTRNVAIEAFAGVLVGGLILV